MHKRIDYSRSISHLPPSAAQSATRFYRVSCSLHDGKILLISNRLILKDFIKRIGWHGGCNCSGTWRQRLKLARIRE